MTSAAGNGTGNDVTAGHAGGTATRTGRGTPDQDGAATGRGAPDEGGAATGNGPGAAGDGAAQQVIRARHAARQPRRAAASGAEPAGDAGRARDIFARPFRDHAHKALGRPVAVLRAGCRAPLGELGLDALRAGGFEITVTTVDQDHPSTRAAVAAGDTGMPVFGDLRSVPLPPRSFDILYCAMLLEHIPHATLVLDRFLAALRPGGLILLRVRDRNCAAAALDRLLPAVARRVIWGRLHPGEPGPLPAVFEPLASERGIHDYALMRGLMIIRQEAVRTPPGVPGPPGPLASAVSAARALITWLSRGRLTNADDELLYVIRRPEDRFARLV